MYARGNSSQVAVFVSTTVSSTGFMASVTVAPVGGVVGLLNILLDQDELDVDIRCLGQADREMTPPGYSSSKLAIRSGRLRAELILAVRIVMEVVLVFGLGFPEDAGLADLGHDLAGPQA
jgi:hypothetical protein